MPLGKFPTPVQKLERLGEKIGSDRLFIKRDDLSGELYGGNKVRKLEFILGQAREERAVEVLTFGFAGSNHALATAIYAKEVGLRSISMFLSQPNAEYVRRNLLMGSRVGAELHYYRNMFFIFWGTLFELVKHRFSSGRFPMVVPPGGSSSRGIIGFVNAAFELKEQVEAGKLPEPDLIYVALGTMGTAVGLVLGLKAAGLKTRVIPVRVVDRKYADARNMARLLNKVNGYLSGQDHSFPRFKFSEADTGIRHDYFGDDYALFTPAGMEAVVLMEECEGIKLEGTYTGKALACLMEETRKNRGRDQVILFWNTYNSRDYSPLISGVDYHCLPRGFHRYFEEEVQPLDPGYKKDI
ncbi:MAG: pyridoxal-phosphate dependent enzyme [Proteobacteria bacterium]|nr:pyridoxal-phosphate dependent enzyme [Pseudomonadota bacterium]